MFDKNIMLDLERIKIDCKIKTQYDDEFAYYADTVMSEEMSEIENYLDHFKKILNIVGFYTKGKVLKLVDEDCEFEEIE